MARYVGIDIGSSSVKLAIVRTFARKLVVEKLALLDRLLPEVRVTDGDDGASTTQDVGDLLGELAGSERTSSDSLSVGIDGTRSYVRTLMIPSAVRRRLAEVLPFELEAQLPFELDEAVYDYRPRPGIPIAEPQPVLTVVSRIEEVRARIEQVQRGVGREPDHVAPGALPLAELSAFLPALRVGADAVVDLGQHGSEFVVLAGGEPVFARTLSEGVAGLPGRGTTLVRELRQSLAAFRAQSGEAPARLSLVGGGALVSDIAGWLAQSLDLPVEQLSLVGIDGLERYPDALRYARAIGIALTGVPRRRGLDLRRGPLTYERGYGFLREKVPLLAGLSATVLVTWLLSTWAAARNLEADHQILEEALGDTSQDVLGVRLTDPDLVHARVINPSANADDDPLPRADAFDVMVQLSELIPTGKMKHDVERLELQRLPGNGFKVVVNGIAPTGAEVAQIETNLKTYRCFNNPTVVKQSKAISDDRQKYTLETELRCPEEGGGPKKPASPAATGSSRP